MEGRGCCIQGAFLNRRLQKGNKPLPFCYDFLPTLMHIVPMQMPGLFHSKIQEQTCALKQYHFSSNDILKMPFHLLSPFRTVALSRCYKSWAAFISFSK